MEVVEGADVVRKMVVAEGTDVKVEDDTDVASEVLELSSSQ